MKRFMVALMIALLTTAAIAGTGMAGPGDPIVVTRSGT